MKHFEDYDQWTRELLDQGKNYSEIGKIQNRSRHSVREHCKNRGWLREEKTNDVRRRMALEQMREQLDAKGYELIDCSGGVDGIVHIKCKVCGGILERKAQVARKPYKILCEHCRQIKHDQEEQDKITKREQREVEKAKRIVYKQQSFFICPECGGLFFDRKKYCSEKCLSRAMSRNGEMKRRSRTKEQLVDKNITLKSLFDRDHGVCYICGEQCDWNDYYYKGETFIAGDSYPSIDHVIPLSKGGAHSWLNVKLSCRKCNYLKSDSLPRKASL